MSDATIPVLDPGDRLLCGPGPSNVHPTVLEAMRLPMNGHLDPDFWDILVDLVAGLARAVAPARGQGLTIALQLVGHERDGGRVHEPHRARRHGRSAATGASSARG